MAYVKATDSPNTVSKLFVFCMIAFSGMTGAASAGDTDPFDLAVAYACRGRYEECKRELAAVPGDHTGGLTQDKLLCEIFLKAARAMNGRGREIKRLDLYNRVLELDSARDDIYRLMVMSLADLGASHLALQKTQDRKDAFHPSDIRRIRSDCAAQLIKWGSFSTDEPEHRFDGTDKALKALEANLADFDPQAAWDLRRERFDRMIALRDRFRMKDVIEEYRRFTEEETVLPFYVLIAVGDAYLYLENPELAIDCYSRALAVSPGCFNARLSLFYALIESNEYREAMDLIESLAVDEPAWRWALGSEIRIVNANKLAAETASAMALAYTGRPVAAQRKLQILVDRAPLNSVLRHNLAMTMLWSGLPEHALEEFEMALVVNPSSAGSILGRAQTLQTLHRYNEAEKIIQNLSERYPENKHVSHAVRDFQLSQGWKITCEIETGESREASLNTPENRGKLYLYARLQKKHCRPYLHLFAQQSDVEGKTLWARGFGAGVRVTTEHRFTVNTECRRLTHDTTDTGLMISTQFNPNDSWQLEARFDNSSYDLPLKAVHAELHGWSAGFSATCRAHDYQSAACSLSYMEMTDGNRREELQCRGLRRLFKGIRYGVTGIIGMYGSRNSAQNAQYFNPEKDFSAEIEFRQELEHTRRYQHALVHRLTIMGGGYWQTLYPGKWIARAAYEQEWTLSDATSVTCGLRWARRVFDGKSDESWQFYTNLGWIF
jgi:biofilm PGA synthesis protein PgaA